MITFRFSANSAYLVTEAISLHIQKMRFAALILLFVCMLAFALSAPAKDKKKPPSCARDCSNSDYNPICSKAKNTSKERLITFGSQCVLDNFNCEHPQDQFEMKNKGECGGNVSVRLS